MLIKDFFYQYKTNKTGVDGFFDQLRLNTKLKNDLNNIKDQVLGVKIMLQIFQIRKKQIIYQNCIDFCEGLGLQTTDDFLNWSNSLSSCKIETLLSYVIQNPPVLHKDTWESTPYNEVKQKILDIVDPSYIESYLKWNWRDSDYLIPNEDDVKNLIEYDESDRFTYISEERDCDDFANLFKCAWERLGVGNVTIAYCEINLYSKDYQNIIGAHAINLILWKKFDGSYEVKLFEPQTDKFYEFGGTIVGMTKYFRIRKLEF